MAKAKRYNPSISMQRQTRGFLLYLFLIPLFLSVVIALFSMKFWAFMLNLIAFMLFYGVLHLSKKGFIQEREYREAIFTKAPKIKYKNIAAYLLGIATFFTAWMAGGEPLLHSIFWAVLAVVGYWLYYGFDPSEDKLEDVGDLSGEVVLETFGEAQRKLAQIEADNKEIKDPVLHAKIQKAITKAQTILDTIADDPKDIRVARKFLIVYIDGVAKVTTSYRALDEADIDALTRQKMLDLMDDVEERFEKELQRLKANNKFDLDVQMDVLKTQIKN